MNDIPQLFQYYSPFSKHQHTKRKKNSNCIFFFFLALLQYTDDIAICFMYFLLRKLFTTLIYRIISNHYCVHVSLVRVCSKM